MADNTKTRELTCIVCPRGCNLTVKYEGKNVLSVEGNICLRGKKYAEDEVICPRRTVTSTVKCEDGGVVAVKTRETIEKEKMFECMEKINSVVASLPVKIGDVILSDVCGTDIIATQNRG